MRSRTILSAAAVSAIFATAACSSSKPSSTTTPPATTGAAATSTAATSAPGSSAAPSGALDNPWALTYTGGTEGKASGDPYKVGYSSQDAFLPGTTIGADAAVAYINDQLGGVGGRPLELVKCPVNAAEDGAKCGTQFANDSSISLVITGTMTLGNKEFYSALAGKKAIMIGSGLATDDFITPAGVSFFAGSPGVVAGLSQFTATDLKAKTVAVLVSDNPGGHAAAEQLIKPALTAFGVTAKPVFVTDGATAPEVQSLIQAAGAAKADAFLPVVDPVQCIAVYDAIKTLGINPPVVTTDTCASEAMTAHLSQVGDSGQVPNGWYFANYGYNYKIPNEDSGMNSYLAAFNKYGTKQTGAANLDPTGFTGPEFAVIMTAAKLINQVGVDKTTYATMNAALRAFKGPQMLQVGDLSCGVAPFTAVCAHQVGVDQYKDGAWVSVRDGLNGKPIELRPPSKG